MKKMLLCNIGYSSDCTKPTNAFKKGWLRLCTKTTRIKNTQDKAELVFYGQFADIGLKHKVQLSLIRM